MSGEEDFGWTITVDRPENLPMTVFYPYNSEESIVIDGKTKYQWEEVRDALREEAFNRVKSVLKGEGIEDEEIVDAFVDYALTDEANVNPDVKKTMDFVLENVAVDEKFNEVIQDIQDVDDAIQSFENWEDLSAEEIQEIYNLPPPPAESTSENPYIEQ